MKHNEINKTFSLIAILLICFLCLVYPAEWNVKEEAFFEASPEHNASPDDGIGEGVALTHSLPADQLKKKLQSVSKAEIVSFDCDDYDGDGAYEAFALTRKPEGSACTWGTWYVSAKELTKLDSIGVSSPPRFFRIDGKKFAAFKQTYATGNVTLLYGVEDGKPYPTKISGKVQNLERVGDDTFTVEQNTLDVFDNSGRTVKTYWLYWDKGFHEYGGIEITEEELLEFKGADNALKEIKDAGGKIINILYRENHIISINYQTPEGYNHYVNLRYDDVSVNKIITRDDSGVYLKALLPDIATYPSGFNSPENAPAPDFPETAMAFSSTDTDLEQLGRDAAAFYYAQFRQSDVPRYWHITKYEILSSKLMAGDQAEFTVWVTSRLETDGAGFLIGEGILNDPEDHSKGGICPEVGRQFRIKALGVGKYEIVSIGTGGDQGLAHVTQLTKKLNEDSK